MAEPTIHLVCNAHIDPVWLWEWEEGAAEALGTFRAAADLCEEFEGFVFNHNEAVLYRFVEEYEPALFERIRRLVRAGRWYVMGGWFLQPDCNMPSGESFVRQILEGKRYFADRLGVEPTTAINFDPFGHTRGLVQILAKSGYDSYVFCRPGLVDCPLPATDFRWIGYDGSEVRATLATSHYNSPPGKARERLEAWRKEHGDVPVSLLLWGVGNHGGGPSRVDLTELAAAMRESTAGAVLHSTPERYVAAHRRANPEVPPHAGDLNPWAVGCYTSMQRVKRAHRRLESELYTAEKLAIAAFAQELAPYPRRELREARLDLVWSEFHDSLPGSSIQAVEESALRSLHHGLELTSRVRARAFFALSTGQLEAREGEFPLLVLNPHPFPIEGTLECELQPQWAHWTTGYLNPSLFRGRTELPCQQEKERSNIDEDHRKRIVFRARLEPGVVNRFDCRLEMVEARPARKLRERNGRIRFRTDELEVVIGARTGLVERYRAHGVDVLQPGALRPLVMCDDADPWGMRVRSFRRRAGTFRLLSREAAQRFSPVPGPPLPSVRVIEDGPVRSVVEALFGFGDSFLCQRYELPKTGTELGVETRVYWNEKDRMLKLSVPTTLRDPAFLGQVAFGVAELPRNGDEAVAQQWVALVDEERDLALTCIDDGIHGFDGKGGELRLSLLRAPAYAGHPVAPEWGIVKKDRFTPRIDQGEHLFRFWFDAGPVRERLDAVDREALARNAPPMSLCFFPPGGGAKPKAAVVLSDPVVQLVAGKLAEDSDELLLRLFEPTGRARTTTVSLPFAGAKTRVKLSGFEVKTLCFDRATKRFREVDLLERPLAKDV